MELEGKERGAQESDVNKQQLPLQVSCDHYGVSETVNSDLLPIFFDISLILPPIFQEQIIISAAHSFT